MNSCSLLQVRSKVLSSLSFSSVYTREKDMRSDRGMMCLLKISVACPGTTCAHATVTPEFSDVDADALGSEGESERGWG